MPPSRVHHSVLRWVLPRASGMETLFSVKVFSTLPEQFFSPIPGRLQREFFPLPNHSVFLVLPYLILYLVVPWSSFFIPGPKMCLRFPLGLVTLSPSSPESPRRLRSKGFFLQSCCTVLGITDFFDSSGRRPLLHLPDPSCDSFFCDQLSVDSHLSVTES